jgi:hypothetical protein
MWNVGPPAGPVILMARALPAQLQLDLEGIVLAIILVGLILLGVIVIVRFKRWQTAQRSPTVPARIEDYRALMEQGLLDPREFERIRQTLEGPGPMPPAPPLSPRHPEEGEGGRG